MPSLHAAFPFLGALFALRLWGRRAWPTLVYTACVWLSIVYLGEHYIVDIIGGVIFALAVFLAKTPSRPGGGRALAERRARRASRPFGRNAPVPHAGLYAHTRAMEFCPSARWAGWTAPRRAQVAV